MSKKLIFIFLIIILFFLIIFIRSWFLKDNFICKNGNCFDSKSTDDNSVVCTMDAKICPDGSFVGRISPDCEFASCPN